MDRERLDPFGSPSIPIVGGDQTFHSGRRLADGAVAHGFRAWRVYANVERVSVKRTGKTPINGTLRLVDDPLNGSLTGVFRTGYIFESGYNTATCARSDVTGHTRAPHVDPGHKPLIGKPTGPKSCGCGFYNYGSVKHEDANPNHIAPNNNYATGLPMYAQGIARTTGRHIFGTRGYLAEKLQIVALVLPLQGGRNWQQELNSVFDLYAPRLERIIREKYPKVAFFDSVQEMVRHFPLTQMPSQ